MRYFVNENCIGCGMCVRICPSVFAMSEDQTAVASGNDVAKEDLVLAEEAADNCPVDAIEER